MIVVGPTIMSGIGQVCAQYSRLLRCQYKHFDHLVEDCNDDVFIFLLPIAKFMNAIKRCKGRKVMMTVCETNTVSDVYKDMFDLYKGTWYVPSEFCKKIFNTQFPDVKIEIIRHWVAPIPKQVTSSTTPYTFYHIGNIIDFRKNIQLLLEAFAEIRQPNMHLIIKSTSSQNIHCDDPQVTVINGLISMDDLNSIHNKSHCYVSCSFSEGVGMGAVEAAMRYKPVIISEFGGAIEYIKTPYVIPCGRRKVGIEEFLYKPDQEWGDPDKDALCRFMLDAYEKQLTYMNHKLTKKVTNGDAIIQNILVACNSSQEQSSIS